MRTSVLIKFVSRLQAARECHFSSPEVQGRWVGGGAYPTLPTRDPKSPSSSLPRPRSWPAARLR